MVAVAEHATASETRRLARLLDSRFRIPGTRIRFGVVPVLGLIPGVGDAAGLALSSYVVLQAVGLGARGATVARMVANIAVDSVFGTIPVIGTAFDVWFKANDRNVALLERHGIDPEGTAQWSRRSLRRTVVGVVVGTVVVTALLFALVAWVVSRLL
jgi:hypothetical protein